MMSKQSMDMLTSVTSSEATFLRGIGSIGKGDSPTTSFKRSQENQEDTSLTLPLVSQTTSIKRENYFASTPHLQSLVSSNPIFSMDELSPPRQQCSFLKSVIIIFIP